MRVEQRPVYTCEYCGRHRLTKRAITGHEPHCTMNPQRHCRLCHSTLDVGAVLEHVTVPTAVPGCDGWTDEERATWDDFVHAVEHEVESCPICMLAVFRQSGVEMVYLGWGYKDALAEWWGNVDSDRVA